MNLTAVIEEVTEYGLVGVSDDTFEVSLRLSLSSLGERVSFKDFKDFISLLKSANQYESFLAEASLLIENIQERMYAYYEDEANNFSFAEVEDDEDIDECAVSYSESGDTITVTIEVFSLLGLDNILDYWNELIAELS